MTLIPWVKETLFKNCIFEGTAGRWERGGLCQRRVHRRKPGGSNLLQSLRSTWGTLPNLAFCIVSRKEQDPGSWRSWCSVDLSWTWNTAGFLLSSQLLSSSRPLTHLDCRRVCIWQAFCTEGWVRPDLPTLEDPWQWEHLAKIAVQTDLGSLVLTRGHFKVQHLLN